MVVAAAEIKVFELELEFELPQSVLRFTHFLHNIRHFFFWSMTLKMSIKLVLSCLVSHLLNKFKISNFDLHDWRTVAWVWTDLNRLKQHFWHDCKQPPFLPIDWNVLQDFFYAVTEHRKNQISSHNSYPTFCWVNLEDFLTLGTLYCLISATRGNIVCIDTGTYDTICISLTLAIRYIDVSVNRYTSINNIPKLVQIMTWHPSGAKPLSGPMIV